MYFNQFPLIPYDSVGQGDFKAVTNILRRVGVRAKIKTNTLLFDTYDVKDGETPESLADKMYDDPELHWVILMVNDITDRYHQWPMATSQFLQYVKDKYDDPNGTHHYEQAQTSGDTSVKINVYSNSALYTGDLDFYNNSTIVTNIEYEQSVQNELRKIRLLDPKYIDQFVQEHESIIKESII